MGWIILILFIIVVLIVWIALTRNSKDSPVDMPVGEHAPTAHETPLRTQEVDLGETAAEAPAAGLPTAVKLDDLTIVEGIGPKVSSVLNNAGIMTLVQLAEAAPEQLKEILEKEGLQFMDPGTWGEQARLAAEGKMAELEALQQELKGGRRID
ncbi:MAG: hypothetical protein IT316_03860 [Anaerolineales bacterium]|nr:hypothetical protein [Anaerolineales bacterium]